MTAGVLCIGTELTRGELVNTNATWLAEELTRLGLEVTSVDCVDDDRGRIEAYLRRLSAEHEARIPDKKPWTLDKLSPETYARLSAAIVGATLSIDALRGARKLSQNKTPEDIARVAQAYRDLAAQMTPK